MESSSLVSRKTSVFGLKLWALIGIVLCGLILLLLLLLTLYLASKKKSSRRIVGEAPSSITIPIISEEIKEVDQQLDRPNAPTLADLLARSACQSSDPKVFISLDYGTVSPLLQKRQMEDVSLQKGSKKDQILHINNDSCSVTSGAPSPILTPSRIEVSHFDWGHCYTFQDLNVATNTFSSSNILGEGGYGIVYRGQLPDGTLIAVKNLLNTRGQAEKEFVGEVEAIGRVRHKNLVRLLGYCTEGSCRMLVYEYVGNGTLDKWLHGPLAEKRPIPWDIRMKIILGTAKGLAYLHEGLEPKVIHRDVKSSNILIDSEWNAKVSDFGLAKLLGSEKSHVTTRVMGTFGYVAPEYASTGLLNERSDVYSFGVLLMELISGREPVDYGRPEGEVNLVDWLKAMVGSRRSEEVADPKLEVKPPARALKRTLLVALRCVDPDSEKRPQMGHVIHMLEADSFPFRDDHRGTRSKKSPTHQEATKQVQM